MIVDVSCDGYESSYELMLFNMVVDSFWIDCCCQMRGVVFMIVDVSSNDTYDTVVILMIYCGEYSNIKKKKKHVDYT